MSAAAEATGSNSTSEVSDVNDYGDTCATPTLNDLDQLSHKELETSENGGNETVQIVRKTRKKTGRKKSACGKLSATSRISLSESHVPPLDFSNYDLQSVVQLVPVYDSLFRKPDRKRSTGAAPNILSQSRVQLTVSEEPVADTVAPKSKTHCVRLCNNKLTSTLGLDLVVQRILLDPAKFTWLDLSFNDLAQIEDSLLACAGLETIYLHSNKIFDILEVRKLAQLSKLRRLTLYGNPVEKHRSVRDCNSVGATYRSTVVAFIPQLQSLDLTAVTNDDRKRAVSWQTLNATKSRSAVKQTALANETVTAGSS